MAALANIYSMMMEKGSQGLSILTSGLASGLTPRLNDRLTPTTGSAPVSRMAKAIAAPLRARVSAETSSSQAVTPLRGFANEDIYFYVKRIDNSGVVRLADPKAHGDAWKLLGTVSAASVLAVGILLPGAYGLIAGYDIQKLQAESKTLEAQKAVLDLREAKLMTPARMEALAAEQGLTDPPRDSVIYLDTKQPDDSSFAANRTPALPGTNQPDAVNQRDAANQPDAANQRDAVNQRAAESQRDAAESAATGKR